MLICWNEQPKERPTFKELRAEFDAMLLAEKKDTYIALCIDESKSYYYQSLPPVTTKDEISASCTSLNTNQKSVCSSKDYSITDKNLSTKKLADFRQFSVSLDEVHTADRRAEVSNHGNRTIRLSLQLLTDDQQGESENRYVKSPMIGALVATSPALSPTINLESERVIEMQSVKQNNPKIEISVIEPQT